MSGCSDARISTALPAHPKTKKLMRRAGPAGCWHLVCLFLWVAGNRSDGNLAGLTIEDVELAADWGGDDGAFVAALCDVGFLDGGDGSYSVHDWADHNPWAAGAEARSEKARFAALCKQQGRSEAAKMMPEYVNRTNGEASEQANSKPVAAISKLVAVPDSATRTPFAPSGSAPSPSPFPSPSPSPSPTKEPEANASLPAGDTPPPAYNLPPTTTTPECPHADIVALYHGHLPANPRIKVWAGARQGALRARWREDPKRQTLEYWDRFLRHVAASPFLTGKVDGSTGRPFLPGLEWLVKAGNFAKIIEGRYHDRQTA